MLASQLFEKQVFERDKKTCVVPGCEQPAIDAHHIMERRLFADDPILWGYHIDNGASVCEKHHLAAEAGHIPPQALRHWLGITDKIYPKYLDAGRIYDKWGNEIKSAEPIPSRSPRTLSFNFSLGHEYADGYIQTKELLNKPLAFTLKKDGYGVTFGNDFWKPAVSVAPDHPVFAPFAERYAAIKNKVPGGVQVFGVWLFAQRSIRYAGSLALKDFLEVFAVYDRSQQLFLSQEEMSLFCKQCGLHAVETLARGEFAKEYHLVQTVMSLGEEVIGKGHEGLVVKSCYPFHFTQFDLNAAKHTREDQPGRSLTQSVIPNEMVS